MALVALVKPSKVGDPVIKQIFDWVTQMEGKVPNHFYVEMNFPEFFKAKLGATKVLWQMGELSMEEIQFVGIVVSKANGCPYCTAAFCTILHPWPEGRGGQCEAVCLRPPGGGEG